MTIAFALQTFKDIEQIERLARALARGTDDRLTVVSHRGSEQDLQRLARIDAIDRVLPSPGGRARFGALDGLISAMRWLEKQSKPYHWFFVMSGQDYPIRPLVELEEELAGSTFDGYFHHFDALNEAEAMAPPMRWPQTEVVDRYHFHYAVVKENPTRLDRALLKLPRLLSERTHGYRLHTSMGLMLGMRPARMPFTPDFRLYGGNYWMTISRKAVQAVLDFVDERPDVVNYFRGVIAPEEAFIHTVLCNNPDLKITKRELRFVEFGLKGHGHLKEFDMTNLGPVLASDRYIGRKFDMRRCPEVLDALDQHIARALEARAFKARATEDATARGNARQVAGQAPLSQAS